LAALYSNENFPLPVVEVLRQLGHDVLTTADTGKAGDAVSDPEVLAFASAQGRALLTLNRRDFIRLHLESDRHHGIIACTFDWDFQGQAQRIDRAIASEKELRGKLVRVNRPA
jgi:predicted nuclease of predicted toxin-antitoxin system